MVDVGRARNFLRKNINEFVEKFISICKIHDFKTEETYKKNVLNGAIDD